MDSERENEMKISNFKETGRVGGTTWYSTKVFATVDVTVGMWWWKRTTQREVCKERHSTFWFFTDAGKFTPDWVIETLARAYYAHKGRMTHAED